MQSANWAALVGGENQTTKSEVKSAVFRGRPMHQDRIFVSARLNQEGDLGHDDNK